MTISPLEYRWPMFAESIKIIKRKTPKGPIEVRSFYGPDEIRRFEFSPKFGTYANYRSLFTRKDTLENKAAQPDNNVVLAVFKERLIVGFGVLAYPQADTRWAKLSPKVMVEVEAIEVSRGYRFGGIGHDLMTCLLAVPDLEAKIAYMVGYCWTWDLDGTRKSAQDYRRMLIKLFKPHGFKEYETNEPNISLKPENLFMARMGKNISAETETRFKWLRFGVDQSEG